VASSDRCRSLPLPALLATASGHRRGARRFAGAQRANRDAASSMASGSPSSRRPDLFDGGALPRPHRPAAGRRRTLLKALRPVTRAAARRITCSPATPSTSRLVLRIDRLGSCGSGATRSSAPPRRHARSCP
jgi:hypothetical protein